MTTTAQTTVSSMAASGARVAAYAMAWQHQPCPSTLKAIRVRVNGDFLTTGRPKESSSP